MIDVVYQGHVIDKLDGMPAGSVHCGMTSPPYWGLRSYKTPPQIWGGLPECEHTWGAEQRVEITGQGWNSDDVEKRREHGARTVDPDKHIDREISQGKFCSKCNAWLGELGLEPTPELYIEHMVQVFRGVWRVLRDDGTLWVNIGDSYASNAGGYDHNGSFAKNSKLSVSAQTAVIKDRPRKAERIGLKPKDLIGIPWMLAFALRADGWYLRSEIIWDKPNPMPESVYDRPTSSHEKIFLLAKSRRYFYDAEAIKEPVTESSIVRVNGGSRANRPVKAARFGGNKGANGDQRQYSGNEWKPPTSGWGGTRNKRSVWRVPTRGYKGAHFATFPEELARTCILAGTSQQGCCSKCGAPWERVVTEGELISTDGTSPDYEPTKKHNDTTFNRRDNWVPNQVREKSTTGWQPTCKCTEAQVVPCVVMDPFAGSGTTLIVAKSAGRNFVGIELQENYLPLIDERLGLFTAEHR